MCLPRILPAKEVQTRAMVKIVDVVLNFILDGLFLFYAVMWNI